ncbi:metal cation zip family protein [Cystoisospora suis]|uniref:Metal cation zip family protein n=1 Tax=Cystoisospora suis TaxID=483139 RepID=A0A2C6KVI8_9APIC|nr:metal cation zip family protein [Cystoisospora suis]
MAPLQGTEAPNFEPSHPAACWGTKVGAVFLLACVGAFGAWIPLALRRCKLEKLIGILNTFAGGAFLGLALFHIMPEASQHVEEAGMMLHVGEAGEFNMAYLFFFVGYVAILICERVLSVGDAESGGGLDSQGTATRIREDPELSMCSSCLSRASQDPCCSLLDKRGLLENDSSSSSGIPAHRQQSSVGACPAVGKFGPALEGEQRQLLIPFSSPRSLKSVSRSSCREGELDSGETTMTSVVNIVPEDLKPAGELASEKDAQQRNSLSHVVVSGNRSKVIPSVQEVPMQTKGAHEVGVETGNPQAISQRGKDCPVSVKFSTPVRGAQSKAACVYGEQFEPPCVVTAQGHDVCLAALDKSDLEDDESERKPCTPRRTVEGEDAGGEKHLEEDRNLALKGSECVLRLPSFGDGRGTYGKMMLPGDEGDMTHTTEHDREGNGRKHLGQRRLEGIDGGAIFLMVALAIHGLFEGMIIGAETNFISVLVVTSVVAGHKWAESLMLMSQFMERGLAPRAYWLLMSVFIASSPVGILVGVGISGGGEVASGVCNALGAGTLIYVATEISDHVFSGSRSRRLGHLGVYCLGATTVLGLTFLDIALEPAPPLPVN